MVKMIATKPITYDRQTLAADDEFEAAEPYATTLVRLGRARRADDESTATKPTGTKSKGKAKAGDDDAQDGTYSTRRLKADD